MTKTETQAAILYKRGLIGITELEALLEAGKISQEAFDRITQE